MNDFNTAQNNGGSPDDLQVTQLRPDLEKDILDATEAHLDGLPPRQTLTLVQALQRLAPAIKRSRAKGYSVDEVAAELTRKLNAIGMTVSGRTLTRLMPSKTAPKAPRKTT